MTEAKSANGHGPRSRIVVLDQPLEDSHTRREVRAFLYREARVLDNRQFDDWLAMLAEEVEYRIPIRATVTREDGDGFHPTGRWMGDDYTSLETRVRRLQSRFPVAEEPPSRTRHFVSNVQVFAGASDDEVHVLSNLLLFRSRGESTQHDLLSAERQDVLRRVNGAWKLARREVLLDQTVLGIQDLSFFL